MSRTFILHTPLPESYQLRFASLTGKEAISEVSSFDLDCLSWSADIAATELLGKSLTIEIINQDGNSRFLNLIVTDFTFVGPDGSAARQYRYRAKLASWLWLADKTADSRIYQNKDIPTIITEVLQDFAMPCQMAVMDQYPIQEYRVQYQETKLHFIKRLAEEAGIFFYVKHELDKHTIFFTDGRHSALPDYEVIPFLTPSERSLDCEEYISEWVVHNQVRSGRFATRSYNFLTPNSTMDQIQELGKGHTNDGLEIYEWSGTYAGRDAGGKLAEVRREQQQLDFETITATSTVRGIAPGYYFTLKNHPRAAANMKYLIVGATYSFQESADTSRSDGNDTSWNVTFTARSTQDRYWPPRVTHRPHVMGVQTAVVSGPGGQTTWTNEYGQVKLSFFWDRYAQHNENDTKWIRVASSWAGSNWGESMVPRIGQEVVVEFEDGDPDRPLVVGRVNNYNQKPTSFSDTGNLPGNVAIAGIKSKEIEGNRYNQMLMDDTTGEIRVQLASEHAKTQLNMGYLVHPRNVSAAPRGEGFELRTDAWGALRADKGLLISTDARPNSQGNALSREELVTGLEHALNLAQGLNKASVKSQGNDSDLVPQEKMIKSVKDWEHGSNTASGTNGASPILALSSTAGIAFATPQSATVAAGQHIDLIAQQNLQISTGQSITLNAKEGISQFAQSGDIKNIAHQGKHIIQAQNDDVNIAAGQSVTITSSSEHVIVAAMKHVTAGSGGGYIKIADGNIDISCPGSVSIKAGNYSLLGPEDLHYPLPIMPISKLDEKPIKFKLKIQDIPGKNGEGWKGKEWKIVQVFREALTEHPNLGLAHLFNSACWEKVLFEGKAKSDGDIGLTTTQQQELHATVCRKPGQIWFMHGAQAAPLYLELWSTDESNLPNPGKILGAMNYSSEQRTSGRDTDKLQGEWAKQDQTQQTVRSLKKKIDL